MNSHRTAYEAALEPFQSTPRQNNKIVFIQMSKNVVKNLLSLQLVTPSYRRRSRKLVPQCGYDPHYHMGLVLQTRSGTIPLSGAIALLRVIAFHAISCI